MNKLDKRYFEGHYEHIKSIGVQAVWVGGERHCGDYPALVSGTPGIYIFSPEMYCSMFYPSIWKYHYGVYAAEQSVHLTAFGVDSPASYPLQLSLFADVPPAIIGGS